DEGRVRVAPLRHVRVLSLPGARRRQDRHSFPTRRSSDLDDARVGQIAVIVRVVAARAEIAAGANHHHAASLPPERNGIGNADFRSEEHTSELQSRSDLVCRLLLEKKEKMVAWDGEALV